MHKILKTEYYNKMNLRKIILLFIVSMFLIVCPSLVTAGQLGQWTTLNYLNVRRYSNIGVLAYDTIIYTLGGFTYSTTPYPVEKAIIYPDGTLSTWSIDSQTMKKARSYPIGFYYNGFIYALGGSDGINFVGKCTTAERVKVNPDGTLEKWEYITPLNYGVKKASLVINPPYVYILGGWNSTTEYSNEIIRGKIQSNSDISEWTISTSQLQIGRNYLSSIAINSTVYVIGGSSYLLNDCNKIECAPIYMDGELGAFKFAGTTKTYHIGPALLHDGKYLYVIGGYSGGGNFEYRGERMLINSDGTLGTPEIAPGLQYETAGFGYVQASTGGYVIGGDCTDVQFAPFLAPTGIEKKYWEILE